MDAQDLLTLVSTHKETVAAVVTAGTGALAWWRNRPRVVARKTARALAGGFRKFRKLSRAERQLRIDRMESEIRRARSGQD